MVGKSFYVNKIDNFGIKEIKFYFIFFIYKFFWVFLESKIKSLFLF